MVNHPFHFEGKNAPEHLKEARVKGFMATREIHGTELSGFSASFFDTAKETATVLCLLTILIGENFSIFLVFIAAYCLWKTSRSAFLGWARIERLHRLIEEERFEIEHHRGQEKEELTAMYMAKGFEGKQLEDLIDVLMADDNRLLGIMLEEELGLSLEVYEHPLRQAFGAFLGVLISGATVLVLQPRPYYLAPFIGAFTVIGIMAYLSAKKESNNPLLAVIWSLSIAGLSVGACALLLEFIKG